MPVFNPGKTVSSQKLRCDGSTVVTLSFEAAPGLLRAPADFVLVMDRSGSMSGVQLAAAKAGAEQLIALTAAASGSPDGRCLAGGSRMGLVSFAQDASADVPLTEDTAPLLGAVAKLSAAGQTNHELAFAKARTLLNPASGRRQVIIMFTDGVSNLGSADPTAQAIRQEGIEIFCIGLVADPEQLNRWASRPTEEHVSWTDDTARLEAVFAEAAALAVQAGAVDAEIREELNPDFAIVSVNPPTHGSVDQKGPGSLVWRAGTVGAAAGEQAVLSFEIRHVGGIGGTKRVNRSVAYNDRTGQELAFPDPQVEVDCGGAVICAEPCPAGATVQVEGCQDTIEVGELDAGLTSLGRIVKVNAAIRNVCPGKRVAAAVILTELDAEGVEHPRGTKTVLIPAQTFSGCRDVRLRCIRFVVPESLDETGSPLDLCNARTFRVRVLANYVDSELICE